LGRERHDVVVVPRERVRRAAVERLSIATGAGNGVGARRQATRAQDPQRITSVAAPPEVIRRWVEAIRKADAQSGMRSVDEYILDNESGLWNSTHRDVHPDPVTYDELLDRRRSRTGPRSAPPIPTP
jgi:hypothetical protein